MVVKRVRAAILASTLIWAGYVVLNKEAAGLTIALATHYLGLFTLFSFLTAGECCHALFWWSSRRGARWSMARIVGVWRVLTEYLPAAAAILISASGLRLLYSLGLSIRLGWLFYLVGGFAALAADGATGYTENVISLWKTAQEPPELAPDEALRATSRRWSFNALFLGHYVAFFVLFGLGYRKPSLYNPFSGIIELTEHAWSSVGRLAPTLTAASFILIVSMAVVLGRVLVKWRRTAQNRRVTPLSK